MKTLFYLTLVLLFISCQNTTSVTGTYYSIDDNSAVESVIIDNNVVSYTGTIGKHIPTATYKVDNNKIYVDTPEGILVFEIIDRSTLKCQTSILKDEVFKKRQ